VNEKEGTSLVRGNTGNPNLIKLLRVFQSLDYDNNASNGIYIDDNTKSYLTQKVFITDENISSLTKIVEGAKKRFKGKRKSREHYIQKLRDLGIEPELMKFITTWETVRDNRAIYIKLDTTAYDYNYTIEWGDGNIDRDVKDTPKHSYSKKGIHTVKISGKFPYIDAGAKIKEVTQWGDMAWESFNESFDYVCDKIDVVATDTPDLRKVTSMKKMFADASELKGNSYFNDWDTSHITDMSYMFNYAIKFNAPINKWDTSSVTTMRGMFSSADDFNQPIGKWDISYVTDLYAMLFDAKKFNQPIGKWDVSNVTNMSFMLAYTGEFNQEINDWDVRKVTEMDNMFNIASKFNKPLNKWKTGNVLTMNEMFKWAYDFNQELKDWDTAKVTNMESMFDNANSFRNHNLRGWNVGNVPSDKHDDFMKGTGGGNTEPKWK
jgi:surface protein